MKTSRAVLFGLLFLCIGLAIAIVVLTSWFYSANIGNKDPDEHILTIVIMMLIEMVLITATSVYAYKYKKNKKKEVIPELVKEITEKA
jgi:uncharacterized membrane protein